MHFMPDTEDADSAAEAFWPENYKQVIRTDARRMIGKKLRERENFGYVYQQYYRQKFSEIDQFVGRIADMAAIGMENGADDAFDEIITAFLFEYPLPQERRYARYLCPGVLDVAAEAKLKEAVIDEYSRDNIYVYAYSAGYQKIYKSFEEYINWIARLVVCGALNGGDNMLEAIYKSLINGSPLPPARRYPRRLKTWVVPAQK